MRLLTVKYPVLFIIIIAVLSRMPYLISPNLLLDGDECVIGLMARHMYEGKGFSIFFWGQQYGFSLIETAAIIPFYLVLGYCTLAVKLGILGIWITGVFFMYKTLCIIIEEKLHAFYLIVLFILFPAWNVMSMKAYGGYNTAFMFSNGLLYLLINDKVKKTWLYYTGIGLLLVLIVESQRLWLAGILPFLLYHFWKEKSNKKTVVTVSSMVVAFAHFYWYRQTLQESYAAISIKPPQLNNISWYFKRFPEYLYGSLHGDYYFNQYGSPYFFNAFLAVLLSVAFFGLFLFGIYDIAFAKKRNKLFIVATVFIPLTFIYSCLTHSMEGRYLLPVSGYLFIALAIYLKNVEILRIAKFVFSIIMPLGVMSCVVFYNYYEVSLTYKRSVFETIDYLKKKDVHYTYSTGSMLPYQIMFYSNMSILSRMPAQPARYQPYSDAVDSAFDAGAKVAMLQYQGLTLDMNFIFDKKTPDIAICLNPPISQMWKAVEFHHIHAK